MNVFFLKPRVGSSLCAVRVISELRSEKKFSPKAVMEHPALRPQSVILTPRTDFVLFCVCTIGVTFFTGFFKFGKKLKFGNQQVKLVGKVLNYFGFGAKDVVCFSSKLLLMCDEAQIRSPARISGLPLYSNNNSLCSIESVLLVYSIYIMKAVSLEKKTNWKF